MELEPHITCHSRVSCDGDVANSRHPRVYLELSINGHVTCPYCSRKFIHKV